MIDCLYLLVKVLWAYCGICFVVSVASLFDVLFIWCCLRFGFFWFGWVVVIGYCCLLHLIVTIVACSYCLWVGLVFVVFR